MTEPDAPGRMSAQIEAMKERLDRLETGQLKSDDRIRSLERMAFGVGLLGGTTGAALLKLLGVG